MTRLAYPRTLATALRGAKSVLVLVPEARVADGWLKRALPVPWRPLVEKAAKGRTAGPSGRTVSCVNPEAGPDRIVLVLLPDRVSRHNAPARSEAIAAALGAADLDPAPAAVVACLEDPAHALAVARAVGRALPRYSRASPPPGQRGGASRLGLLFLDPRGRPVPLSTADRHVVDAARWAALLVDTPPAEMSTADFQRATRREARGVTHLSVSATVGSALLARGLGGIHAVGRAAQTPPRLLLLRYRPPRAARHVGLVGKGIVYDTGGLSLKPTQGMSGMKADMAGAAAVVGATLALARARAPIAVTCAAPLAENAIGPGSYRNDDILRLHSGKTVEINNTDAEGRLLLADAVSYVARRFKPDAVVDAATLTGAQLVATGVRHAAVVSNREGLERLAEAVGRETGDLVHPLPFAPEFYQEEFKSKVADMRNSVASRMNAQSSCAAQFVYSHVADLDPAWLHVDLAGPAFRDQRATGYGVALLVGIARALDDETLAS